MNRIDRSMIFLLAALLVLPALALAQPPGTPGNGPGDGPGFGPRQGHGLRSHGSGGRGPFGNLDFLTRFLDLTEEQREQAQALREGLREDSQALRGDSRTLREDLRTELDAEAPDPTRVGELTLALHAQRAELRGLAEQALADFEALLTPEQLASFQQLRETVKERRQERREQRRERRPGRRGGV